MGKCLLGIKRDMSVEIWYVKDGDSVQEHRDLPGGLRVVGLFQPIEYCRGEECVS
jgi:hypothetical protein